MRSPAGIATGLLLALAALPLWAGSAAAHGDAEPTVGDSLPVVRAIEPAVPGLTITVIEGGARLRLDNGTAHQVDVVSAATRVPPGGSTAWADPRVTDASWTLPLLVGGQPVTVSGERVSPAAPAAAPWWALTLAAALGTFCLGGTAALRHRDGRPSRAADLGVAGVALAVVTAHVLHVVGSVLVAAAPPSAGGVLAAAGLGVLCWFLGLLGAGLVVARQPLGTAVCGSAGALAALLTGFDTAGFARPVLAFGWAFDLDRATTVVAFGGGLGLLLVGWVALSTGSDERAVQPSS